MFFWTLNYHGKTSYLIPTQHYSIKHQLTEETIEILKTIIHNASVVCFESNVVKQKITKTKKNTNNKYKIKNIYNHDDLIKIKNLLEKHLKFNITIEDIGNKTVTQLTPGPGLGSLLCSKLTDAMDLYLDDYAKQLKRKIIYLDEGQNYKKFVKQLSDMVILMKTYLLQNPPSISDINKHIILTKKSIADFRKLFTNKNTGKLTKKHSTHNNSDRHMALDSRNNIWITKIGQAILNGESLVAFVGSNHIDKSIPNNILDLLEQKYNLKFNKDKFSLKS